jgi:hypothetical protein
MIELEIAEEEAIGTIIFSVSLLIDKGVSFKITHTLKQPLSWSQRMSSRRLKNMPDSEVWADDVRK